MAHRIFKYRFCLASEQSLREAAGYSGGAVSEDGLLVVGDKADEDTSLGDLAVPDKPDWIDCETWPFADHEETLSIVRTQETSEGAADRWCSIPEGA